MGGFSIFTPGSEGQVDIGATVVHVDLVNGDLAMLGYSSFFREHAENYCRGSELSLVPARVVGQHRREWDVWGEDLRGRAVLAGKRWAKENVAPDAAQPAIGDWVLVRVPADATSPVIEHILPRRTELSRSTVGKRGQKQVIVANIDLVAVVAALSPEGADETAAARSVNPRRLERYLAAVESGGARAVILLNKADQDPTAEEKANDLRQRLGHPVLCTSAKRSGGLTVLEELLKEGETVGFVGLSGVGKSSLVNALLGETVQRTFAERASDARGRHTTTHRELFVTAGGHLLIDTPGMREFALADGDETDLTAFADIVDFAKECRFSDCGHQAEPGCRVRAAVREGTLPLDRLQHYLALKSELSDAAQRRREPSRRGPKR